MNEFKLRVPYEPTGDQPQAIARSWWKGFQGRKSVRDAVGGDGFRQDLYDGKCDRASCNKPTLVHGTQ